MDLMIVEEYYRNGQFSYRENYIDNDKIEEIFSKSGDLMIRFVNGIIEFSVYEKEMDRVLCVSHICIKFFHRGY